MTYRALSIAALLTAAAWAQAPAVTGIAHAAFRVSDIQTVRPFYKKLGFEQFFEFSKDGKTTEAFLKVNDRQFIELYPRSAESEAPGLMHVCYESNDVDAVNQDLVRREAKPTPVRKGGAGNMLFSLRDPEGQVIEYTQYMPGSRHSEDRGKHLGERRISERLVGVAILAQDVAAAREYYVRKLGFEDLGGKQTARFRVAGGQEVTIAPAGAGAKPGLVFAVDDVQRTASELERRGFTVTTSEAAASVTDPDGVVVSFVAQSAQQKYFSDWPARMSPQEIGKRVAERFASSPHYFTSYNNRRIVYPEVCTWYGALTFAAVTGAKDLSARLVKRFEPLLGPEDASLVSHERHVDFTVFAALPLEIYLENKDPRTRELGMLMADRQWSDPRPDGLTSETRFWIDDMYMITAAQVQAFRATNDPKYLDRAALEMVAYLEKLQKPNGLFHHADDVPFFWGRGNGWMAAGMAELLQSLPAEHPKRASVLAGYRKMMKALLEHQGLDGMWRQLVDHPESWPESSSTGMFTFAMVTGVKNGWLEPGVYGPATRKAWIALAGYVDQNADVTSVCEGTNKLNDLDYYLLRMRRTGDLHGQAPVLWSATALLR